MTNVFFFQFNLVTWSTNFANRITSRVCVKKKQRIIQQPLNNHSPLQPEA